MTAEEQAIDWTEPLPDEPGDPITPEQQAKKVIIRYFGADAARNYLTLPCDIGQLVREAVAEEREACAKLVEAKFRYKPLHDVRQYCQTYFAGVVADPELSPAWFADAIRARK